MRWRAYTEGGWHAGGFCRRHACLPGVAGQPVGGGGQGGGAACQDAGFAVGAVSQAEHLVPGKPLCQASLNQSLT